MSNEVVDYETVDGVLNQFAKRDPAGYLVWGSKISLAYRTEVKNRKDKANGVAKCGSIGLGRGLTLGQMSLKKKGGVE